jgi:hypothetical protein
MRLKRNMELASSSDWNTSDNPHSLEKGIVNLEALQFLTMPQYSLAFQSQVICIRFVNHRVIGDCRAVCRVFYAEIIHDAAEIMGVSDFSKASEKISREVNRVTIVIVATGNPYRLLLR